MRKIKGWSFSLRSLLNAGWLICKAFANTPQAQYFFFFNWSRIYNKHVQYFFFVILFFLVYSNTAISQIPDTSKKATYDFGLSWAIGPQFSMTDDYDYMIGLNMMINSLVNHHVPIGIDLHAAISNQNPLTFAQFAVAHIVSGALISGFRVYVNRYSAFQFTGGISYGVLDYHGKRYPPDKTSWYGDGEREEFKFIGLPIKASYILVHKVVGLEIYVSAHFHSHFETVAGLNFLLGRLK